MPLWLRLASVIPKDFSGLLDDARAQANFFVNLMYLSLLIALISLFNALYGANWHKILNWSALGPGLLRHGVIPAIALIVSFVSYSWANARVMAWGDLVRSAFHCYLTALIKQLGFAIPPTEAERKEFWHEFNALVTYQQQMSRPWPIAAETSSGGKEAKSDNEAKSDEAKSDNEEGEST